MASFSVVGVEVKRCLDRQADLERPWVYESDDVEIRGPGSSTAKDTSPAQPIEAKLDASIQFVDGSGDAIAVSL